MADQRISGMRILLVEDDAALREAISDTLELAGTQVFAVAGGAQALQVLAAEAVDLVVSDVNMDAWMDTPCCVASVNTIRRCRWC